MALALAARRRVVRSRPNAKMTTVALAVGRVRIRALKPMTVAFASTCFRPPPHGAAPPMWKVRIVSCVPGSPIDWAAMTRSPRRG